MSTDTTAQLKRIAETLEKALDRLDAILALQDDNYSHFFHTAKPADRLPVKHFGTTLIKDGKFEITFKVEGFDIVFHCLQDRHEEPDGSVVWECRVDEYNNSHPKAKQVIFLTPTLKAESKKVLRAKIRTALLDWLRQVGSYKMPK